MRSVLAFCFSYRRANTKIDKRVNIISLIILIVQFSVKCEIAFSKHVNRAFGVSFSCFSDFSRARKLDFCVKRSARVEASRGRFFLRRAHG